MATRVQVFQEIDQGQQRLDCLTLWVQFELAALKLPRNVVDPLTWNALVGLKLYAKPIDEKVSELGKGIES